MRRFDDIFGWAKFPSLVKEGGPRHQKNNPVPLKARTGWFVQQPIIGGLNQPPRLRPLRRLRDIFLMGAATPPWPRRGILHAALSFFAASYLSSPAFSQNPAPAHPDLSGYWELRYDSFNVPAASLTAKAAADQANQRQRDSDAIRWCINVGVPALMGDRAPLDLRQSPTVIGMVAKSPSSVRYIYTDGRDHPDKDDLDPTTNGDSIGHWDGDTLVVDTIGFNDRGVRTIPGGGVRTPNSHLTERYRLLEGGQRLSVTFTWEDPYVFQKPHTYEFRYYRVRQISEPRVITCNPGDAERAKFLLGEK